VGKPVPCRRFQSFSMLLLRRSQGDQYASKPPKLFYKLTRVTIFLPNGNQVVFAGGLGHRTALPPSANNSSADGIPFQGSRGFPMDESGTQNHRSLSIDFCFRYALVFPFRNVFMAYLEVVQTLSVEGGGGLPIHRLKRSSASSLHQRVV